jgi:Peptidase family M28
VVATLPGTQPEARDRLYVVSGHYDSRASDPLDATSEAPGANDGASGTAAVMELARVMARHRFDATLVFLAVAGEEQSLDGSTHFARQAAQKKLNVAGMITNDIIGNSRRADGRVDRSRVRLFAEGVPPAKEVSADLQTLVRTGGENDSPPRQLARAIKELGERYVKGVSVVLVYRRDRYLRGGDHAPFLERGYPAVRFTEPVENYRRQHQNVRAQGGVECGDVPEQVDFAYVAQVARLNAAALAGLARAPAVPSGVEIETTRLENDSTLRWTVQPGAGPGRLPHRLAGDHRALLGAGARRRQRHPLHARGDLQGQRHLRGRGRGQGGPRQPRGLPPARAVGTRCLHARALTGATASAPQVVRGRSWWRSAWPCSGPEIGP